MIEQKKQSAFSLIELMVGMVIGLLVTGIIITVFSQSKRNYNQDDEIAQLQENGRYVLQLLTREFSMAGFAGPAYIVGDISSTVTGTPCGFTNWYDVSEEPLLFPSSTPSCLSGVKDNTDIVVIKGVVGDKKSGKLFLRTNGTGGTIYPASSTVVQGSTETDWEYQVRIYYIKDKTVDGETIPTLRRALLKNDMSWDDQELAQGIENLRVSFGIDTDADGAVDTYTRTKDDPGVLSKAAMARVDILVRSINTDPNYTNDKTYYAGSSSISSTLNGTNYYGRVFSTTVPMRNISYRNTL